MINACKQLEVSNYILEGIATHTHTTQSMFTADIDWANIFSYRKVFRNTKTEYGRYEIYMTSIMWNIVVAAVVEGRTQSNPFNRQKFMHNFLCTSLNKRFCLIFELHCFHFLLFSSSLSLFYYSTVAVPDGFMAYLLNRLRTRYFDAFHCIFTAHGTRIGCYIEIR